MEEYQLNYRACIPLYILLDPDLSKNEIAMYGLIEQLEYQYNGQVFINNATIAKNLGVSHESRIVNKMYAKMRDKGYLKKERKLVKIEKNGEQIEEMRLCWSTIKKESKKRDDKKSVDKSKKRVAEVHKKRVAEVHIYNNLNNTNNITPKSTVDNADIESSIDEAKKETKENVCCVFSEKIDKQLLEHKHDKNISDLEALRQYKHHIDTGNPELPDKIKIKGLASLLKSKRFTTPRSYSPSFNQNTTPKRINPSPLVAYSNFVEKIKGDKVLKLIPSNTYIPTYNEWIRSRPVDF